MVEARVKEEQKEEEKKKKIELKMAQIDEKNDKVCNFIPLLQDLKAHSVIQT